MGTLRLCLVCTSVVLLTASACRQGPDASFLVKISKEQPESVEVELEIRNVVADSLTLRAFGSSAALRLSDFEATDLRGSPLRVEPGFRKRVVDGKAVEIPQYALHGPLPPVIRVRYRVQPGSREGDSHVGFTGRAYGYSGSEFSFVTGRNLFLVPEPPESLAAISVRFDLPQEWNAMAPWRWDGRQFNCALDGDLAAEHLVKASIGLGRFRERAVEAGGTRFRMVFESGIPAQVEQDVSARLESVIRSVEGLFGRGLGPEYLIVVAPGLPGGEELVGDGWATGQGGTLAPMTANRLHTFATRLLDAYLRLPPYRSEIGDLKEFWMADAIRNLYSWRVVARAGLMPEDEIVRETASQYLDHLHVGGLQRDLEQIYTGRHAHQVEREVFAPMAWLLLERELQTSTKGTVRLEDLIARMFHGRRATSLWSLLPAVRPGLWEEFQKQYVRGNKHAPVEDLYSLTPVGPSPEPPAGKRTRQLTLAYTGETEGYLENCGCKSNQSGGVARRATALERIRRADPRALVLDAGGAFMRPTTRAKLDFLSRQEQGLYLGALGLMRYDAVAVGTNELAFGLDYFREQTRSLTTRYVVANVRMDGRPIAPPVVRRTVGGLRVAVIGVLEPPRGRGVVPGFEDEALSLMVEDPVQTLRREVPALARQADLVIALGRLTPFTIRRVAEACPELDVIISSEFGAPARTKLEGHEHLHAQDGEGFVGRTLVLYTHLTSYGLSTARLGVDADGRITDAVLDDIWLNEKVPDHPQMRRTLNTFYDRVGRQAAAQESVQPLFTDDPLRLNGRYAGASECSGCHEAEYKQWMGTAHAGAFKTLLDRHRNFQPKCVSCHVVGYGTRHGYRLGAPEQTLANVQCEVCHGPGAEHVASPSISNIQRQVSEKICLECHNPEHSDHFVYAERLPLVRHDSSANGQPQAVGSGAAKGAGAGR